MDAALQELVRQRARFRCEYCLLPEALVSTPFQFDHNRGTVRPMSTDEFWSGIERERSQWK